MRIFFRKNLEDSHFPKVPERESSIFRTQERLRTSAQGQEEDGQPARKQGAGPDDPRAGRARGHWTHGVSRPCLRGARTRRRVMGAGSQVSEPGPRARARAHTTLPGLPKARASRAWLPCRPCRASATRSRDPRGLPSPPSPEAWNTRARDSEARLPEEKGVSVALPQGLATNPPAHSASAWHRGARRERSSRGGVGARGRRGRDYNPHRAACGHLGSPGPAPISSVAPSPAIRRSAGVP